ncbi:MAG: class I SAM-dependent rRNA methyltransferase [Bacteroidales bacterium]|nr:class I SAM-dependent rRNA methyltransferase [Bacteroidales bacterium]
MVKVFLKHGRDESLRRFHPWVFSGAVAQVQGSPAEGDIVGVYSAEGQFLASGHWQVGSIAVRILSFDADPTAPDFWINSIARALQARIAVGLFPPVTESSEPATASENRSQQAGLFSNPCGPLQGEIGSSSRLSKREGPAAEGSGRGPAQPDVFGDSSPVGSVTGGTSCFRLVHGEGDGLPGLIIDWYDGVCVMQAHSVGMFRAKAQICDALKTVFGERLKAVYDKSSGTAPFKAGLELIDGYLYRAPGFEASETVVLENGRKFLVNWEEGQKTGFFLDQRDNRALVGKYAAGRRVLNLFCYTGGFSIYALTSGAALVDSVDSSARAMDLVARNIALNPGEADVHNYCEDAIEFLRKTPEGKYDLIIVDPPAFAKHRGALKNALRAYQRLNAAAIARVAPGGLVFTFSCSQVVDKITFANTVFSAAAQTGRSVRILDRLCQGADHPVSIYHPEGEYLKGLLLYVE